MNHLMLWRHSALYLLARGLPGAISLAAIAVFTRLLGADEYGRYALVIAGVGLGNKLVFEWLRLSLLRFRPGFKQQLEVFDATIAAAFLALFSATALLGGIALLATPAPGVRAFMAAGIALLWIQALFDLELHRARSELRPQRYGVMAFGRAALALALGVLFVIQGLGPLGLLLGLIVAMLAMLGKPLFDWAKAFRLRACDWSLMAELCRYGGPLAVTGALSFMINSSDRFLIGWLLNDAAVGRYAVAYDLTGFSIGLLLMIVNLAAYPLVIRALQDHGAERARTQLVGNLTALLAVGLPATIGLAVLAEPVAQVVLGREFQDDAAILIPLIAAAALLRDLKAYYLDQAFQLGRSTVGQMWVTGIALVTDVLLVLWWVPLFGIVGAAWASIVAYVLALVLSAILGSRVFALPWPSSDSWRIVAAAATMGAALWPFAGYTGIVALMAQIACGALVYALLMWLLDVGSLRTQLKHVVGHLR